MTFSEYAKKIESFGRAVSLEAITQTRDLITPQLDSAPDVNLQSDVSYGEHERHLLDVFTPSEGKDTGRPLLIFIHGGGFIAGDKCMPGTPFYGNVGAWAVRNGFNAINATYRLAPENQWPSGVEDMHRIIQFVKNKGVELGLGTDQIFLMGHSAGATHVATYVAHPEIYRPAEHGISGLVLLSGLYDYTTMQVTGMEKAYFGDDASQYEKMGSIPGLLKTDLPILMAAAEHDPHFFEAQALQLLNALQKKHQKMPSFVHLIGQNHLSETLYLGLEGDLLGPQLKHFIGSHT